MIRIALLCFISGFALCVFSLIAGASAANSSRALLTSVQTPVTTTAVATPPLLTQSGPRASAPLPAQAPPAAVPQAAAAPVVAIHQIPAPSPMSASLAELINSCATEVSPGTEAAVIAVESAGDAWVLHDDNDDRVYHPRSYDEAVALANALISHNSRTLGKSDRGVDVGMAQINSLNFASFNVDAATMLRPCANLAVSSHMLSRNFAEQLNSTPVLSLDPSMRLAAANDRTLQVYNSGRPTGDEAYARRVMHALDSPLVTGVLSFSRGARPAGSASFADDQPPDRVAAAAPPESSQFYHEQHFAAVRPESAAPAARPTPLGFGPPAVNVTPAPDAARATRTFSPPPIEQAPPAAPAPLESATALPDGQSGG
jgi:type IV secretion system protein VirB1